MNLADAQIDEIISKQEMQKVKEIGELLEQHQKTLLIRMPSVKFAKVICEELKINYGSSLCLVFWLEELLKMHTDYPTDKKIYSSNLNKQRTIHIGRLIQIGGGKKALNYCLSKIPECVQPNLKFIWDSDGTWVKRRR